MYGETRSPAHLLMRLPLWMEDYLMLRLNENYADRLKKFAHIDQFYTNVYTS